MGRPNLFALNSWAAHEDRVLEIFHGALVRLASQRQLPEKEDELNRKLLRLCRKENYRLIRQGKGRGTHSNIYYEASNQPAVDDIVRAARESKRPDFTCGFVDSQAGMDRFLVLEGKRLGQPPSPSWVLNENYIKNGVRRFIDIDWAYGKDTASGVMIGYVQSMKMNDILKEVNVCGRSMKTPKLTEIVGKQNGLMRFQQRIKRKFPETPFRLIHIWVDMKKSAASRAIKVA
jgi:hypothetical protein